MTKNLKRIVSAFLVILYSVIGIAGESAHYCFENTFSPVASRGEVKQPKATATVYHHRHGPGDHWHYHPVHDQQIDSQKTTGTGVPGFTRPTSIHTDHACPLLSILRLLEMGSGKHAHFSSRLVLTSELLTQEQFSIALPIWSQNHVRGPPLGILA